MVNTDGFSALDVAIKYEDETGVAVLLQAGARVRSISVSTAEASSRDVRAVLRTKAKNVDADATDALALLTAAAGSPSTRPAPQLADSSRDSWRMSAPEEEIQPFDESSNDGKGSGDGDTSAVATEKRSEKVAKVRRTNSIGGTIRSFFTVRSLRSRTASTGEGDAPADARGSARARGAEDESNAPDASTTAAGGKSPAKTSALGKMRPFNKSSKGDSKERDDELSEAKRRSDTADGSGDVKRRSNMGDGSEDATGGQPEKGLPRKESSFVRRMSFAAGGRRGSVNDGGGGGEQASLALAAAIDRALDGKLKVLRDDLMRDAAARDFAMRQEAAARDRAMNQKFDRINDTLSGIVLNINRVMTRQVAGDTWM
jgi:hypothetical protein